MVGGSLISWHQRALLNLCCKIPPPPPGILFIQMHKGRSRLPTCPPHGVTRVSAGGTGIRGKGETCHLACIAIHELLADSDAFWLSVADVLNEMLSLSVTDLKYILLFLVSATVSNPSCYAVSVTELGLCVCVYVTCN